MSDPLASTKSLTYRELDIVDAIKMLERIVGECDEGTSDHAWRKCRRCLTLHELQNHQQPAERLLKAVIEALKNG